MRNLISLALLPLALLSVVGPAQPAACGGWSFPDDDSDRLHLRDVFQLEWASNPQLSPDGEDVIYVRNRFDLMEDRRRGALWLIEDVDGAGDHRPLFSADAAADDGSPLFSPDGAKVLFARSDQNGTQLMLFDRRTEVLSRLTQLTRGPGSMAFSSDGEWIALTIFEPEASPALVNLPAPPDGASWAPPPLVVDDIVYRSDGAGYLEDGHTQLFVLPTAGGTPRQLTRGAFDVQGTPTFTRDGSAILFTSNRNEGWRFDPLESEIYRIELETGDITAVTERKGPDAEPKVSPDGRFLAYTGLDDKLQGYQISQLSVRPLDGGEPRVLAADLDRDISSPVWAPDGGGIYFSYSDRGNGKVGYVPLDGGEVEVVAGDVGGTTLGRPYASGSFAVAGDRVVYTYTRPDHPADVAVARRGEAGANILTRLNHDLLGHKELGAVEEMWVESSHDGRRIQSWIVKPPGFDPSKKYPMVLEIHGGPFADYGDRFTAEVQLFAAAGYVGLYVNPRGSSSYGAEFGNLIHHAYPSHDYDDLMSSVDGLLAKGYVDPDQLFVTGGSGGGVLTAWIVGHTDRFRAAVVAKPVINWTSFVFTADNGPFFWKYWFPGLPWETPENYFERSPLSYAGNVETPTMLLTGDADYRTPIS
ncbi:MAG: S9 family peptidase, partial [Acidobacteriota bacterium]